MPSEVPADFNGKVLHARMNLGGTELLGGATPGYQPMRSAYLSLSATAMKKLTVLGRTAPRRITSSPDG